LAAVLLLGLGTTGAAAGSQYETLYVLNTPLKLELPTSWNASAIPRGHDLAFLSWSPSGDAYLGIAELEGMPRPFPEFAAEAVYVQRYHYREVDPSATVRHRHRSFPIGPTEQIIIRYYDKGSPGYPAQQIQEVTYWFWNGRYAYNMTCSVPAAKLAAYLPICEHAAKSLRPRRL
jgi:hypothetical protein